ncbi:MAG: tripartite tricarboxylate transporter substrate binding protein [Alphaproteobacteria bacterium]|nr:tripartite tricarboxylate transporter substrate binding protein [Alphaproteobacteria bacterium]
MNIRHVVSGSLAIVTALLAATSLAQAQAGYPNKAIKLVVPYNPGGSSDLTTRFIADMAKDILGQPVVVENRPGAGGTIGIGSVASSAPDGYTFSQITASPIIVRPHVANVPYDPRKDLTFLGRYMVTHAPFAVKADSPFKTIQDALSFAKSNPGKLRWAVGAPQGGPHLATEAMLRAAGAQATLVPVNGGAEALLALMGGSIEAVVVDDYARPLRDGEIRLLAESGPVKVKGAPNVPTYRELGYPLSPTIFYGLVGPAGLPSEVVAKWNATLKQIVESDKFRELTDRINATPFYGNSADFTAQVKQDYEQMGKALADLGLAKK